MEILVNKRNEVLIDGLIRYVISYKSFTLLNKYTLTEFANKQTKLILKEVFTPFRISYDICRGNEIYKFRIKYYRKTQYNCQVNDDLYEIFSHKGRKYTVFKNTVQVAWWDSDIMVLLGNKYKIIADKDCDYELIISFCLILRRSGEGATIDFGNIGGEGKRFDVNWHPK